jgi:hypothetical protein
MRWATRHPAGTDACAVERLGKFFPGHGWPAVVSEVERRRWAASQMSRSAGS